MSDKKMAELLMIFFVLLWVIITAMLGGIAVGMNLIIPVFSTIRLLLGVSAISFAVSVLFMVCNYNKIIESLEFSDKKRSSN